MKIRKSDNTVRAYGTTWRSFEMWCDKVGERPMPASANAVAGFLRARAVAGKSLSTISKDRSAIAAAHKDSGFESPAAMLVVENLMRTIAKETTREPVRKKPITDGVLAAMLQCCPSTLLGGRNAALLTFARSGAFRRSELVAIRIEDLTFTDKGVDVFLGRSKTDQDGKGQSVAISEVQPFLPVQRLQEWLQAAGILEGPIFRSMTRGDRVTGEALTPQSVALIVKQCADAAGLDPRLYSGESTRSGFVSSKVRDGCSMEDICRVTRHDVRRMAASAAGYIRASDEAML